jgi:hypothetical protein
MSEFEPFQKIARWSRKIVISEKIDGTNAQIFIPEGDNVTPDMIRAGSRNQWLTEKDHNFGFAKWVAEHAPELLALGPGRHYGEWWGLGIQRNYGLKEKRFSLFNAGRWDGVTNIPPACCHVVPIIETGDTPEEGAIGRALQILRSDGSVAAPGFMKPEGIIIYHAASRQLFKKTLERDEYHKGETA